LSLMGVRLVRGRAFTAADSGSAAPAIIVNATLGRMLFGTDDPLDREMAYGTLEGPRTARIVGIAADTKNRSLRDPTGPMVYVPVTQETKGRVLLHVRTTTPTAAFASRVSAEVRRAAPGAPNVSFTTVRERLGQSLADVRLIARLGAVFSGLALVLAVAGLYGVVAYRTARRRREFGVRLALGASPAQIAGLVTREGLGLVSIGLTIGALGAVGAGQLLRNQLFGVTPYDPLTLVAIAGVLCIAALVATLVPAVTASRVDPMGSLRQD
ncbi:MAG TPA: FtsX-like permease family protein, partial [Gemmatimonadaceae bacterium]|nr:FtsX-like permease family protein [Gemmatimonadaceae bacterium]